MVSAKVTSKGQITIPKAVRDRLGLDPGDEVEFIEDDGAFRIRKERRTSRYAGYRGSLKGWTDQDPEDLLRELRGR
jgi:AbrB family looped-hinge helix DNA binding protein